MIPSIIFRESFCEKERELRTQNGYVTELL